MIYEQYDEWKCPHCFDTGRMSIGSGMDCADCTYCESNSFECEGCTCEGCRGCKGSVKPRTLTEKMYQAIRNISTPSKATLKALQGCGIMDMDGELTQAGRNLAENL